MHILLSYDNQLSGILIFVNLYPSSLSNQKIFKRLVNRHLGGHWGDSCLGLGLGLVLGLGLGGEACLSVARSLLRRCLSPCLLPCYYLGLGLGVGLELWLAVWLGLGGEACLSVARSLLRRCLSPCLLPRCYLGFGLGLKCAKKRKSHRIPLISLRSHCCCFHSFLAVGFYFLPCSKLRISLAVDLTAALTPFWPLAFILCKLLLSFLDERVSAAIPPSVRCYFPRSP